MFKYWILTLISFLFIIQSINYCTCNEKEFRMQKLNLVWEKASKKLSKEKLKSLYTDLRYQDKEELALKKLKAEGLDKKNSKQAILQNSFNALLSKYGLTDDFKAIEDSAVSGQAGFSNSDIKFIFRDKKLNKLWLKAEKQGFSDDDLKLLKEEFEHHQNKIDQYYHMMETINEGSWHNDDPINTLSQLPEVTDDAKKKWKSEENPHQLLKEKHAALKSGYDYLTRKIVPSFKNMEFDEPHVNGLWEMAKNGNFSDVELESLRGELHHFEHRIRKYKHLSELELRKEDEANLVEAELAKRQKRLKEYQYKVEKIQNELTERITNRHTEL